MSQKRRLLISKINRLFCLCPKWVIRGGFSYLPAQADYKDRQNIWWWWWWSFEARFHSSGWPWTRYLVQAGLEVPYSTPISPSLKSWDYWHALPNLAGFFILVVLFEMGRSYNVAQAGLKLVILPHKPGSPCSAQLWGMAARLRFMVCLNRYGWPQVTIAVWLTQWCCGYHKTMEIRFHAISFSKFYF